MKNLILFVFAIFVLAGSREASAQPVSPVEMERCEKSGGRWSLKAIIDPVKAYRFHCKCTNEGDINPAQMGHPEHGDVCKTFQQCSRELLNILGITPQAPAPSPPLPPRPRPPMPPKSAPDYSEAGGVIEPTMQEIPASEKATITLKVYGFPGSDMPLKVTVCTDKGQFTKNLEKCVTVPWKKGKDEERFEVKSVNPKGGVMANLTAKVVTGRNRTVDATPASITWVAGEEPLPPPPVAVRRDPPPPVKCPPNQTLVVVNNQFGCIDKDHPQPPPLPEPQPGPPSPPPQPPPQKTFCEETGGMFRNELLNKQGDPKLLCDCKGIKATDAKGKAREKESRWSPYRKEWYCDWPPAADGDKGGEGGPGESGLPIRLELGVKPEAFYALDSKWSHQALFLELKLVAPLSNRWKFRFSLDYSGWNGTWARNKDGSIQTENRNGVQVPVFRPHSAGIGVGLQYWTKSIDWLGIDFGCSLHSFGLVPGKLTWTHAFAGCSAGPTFKFDLGKVKLVGGIDLLLGTHNWNRNMEPAVGLGAHIGLTL